MKILLRVFALSLALGHGAAAHGSPEDRRVTEIA